MEETLPFIRNEKEADVFLRQLLNIGEAMYQSGGEISRIEDSLHRLGKAYGAHHVSVYAITSSIVITVEFPNNSSYTQNRRILKRGSVDCLKMEKLNQLCRDCQAQPVPVADLRQRVLAILQEKPDKRMLYLGQLLAAFSFAVFFGGNGRDAVLALLGALIICLLQEYVKRYFHAEFFFNLVASFITGAFVNLVSLLLPGLHVNQILIGDIMVLIPGIAITNSIRYIFSGDIVSSLEKLIDSLIQAFGIAIGFMLSLMLIQSHPVSAPALEEPLRTLVQVLAAGCGTLTFCVIFNMRRRYLAVPAIGGLLCWGAYLFLQSLGLSLFASTLCSSVFVGLYGNLMSRRLKVPTTILFIPACVPLIPGGNLYYMALAMLSSDWGDFRQQLSKLALYAVGISMGLAIVSEADKILRNIRKYHA